MKIKPLGIYVHIPFCVKKCNYCDFLSFGTGCIDSEQIKLYIDAIKRELLSYKKLSAHFQVETIYFGGGTPSLIDAEYITEILDCIREQFNVSASAEITVECNPGTTTLKKFQTYKAAGVNRLSIGLQSTDDEMLKVLGRVHTFSQFQSQYEDARKAGFDNISLDLMSALPGQTLEQYQRDVARVLALNPEHISSYGLIIEEGTPFYENVALQRTLPEEETAIAMYEDTKRLLAEKGYQRYEISNYAKPGYESRHNSSYWTGISYIGIGLGASSYLKLEDIGVVDHKSEGIRYQNVSDLDAYCEDEFVKQMPEASEFEHVDTYINEIAQCKEDVIYISQNDAMEEFMFLGLRMMKGVSDRVFRCRFGVSIREIYGDILAKHIGNGNIICSVVEHDEYYALSDQGILISNPVLSDFLLD